MEYQLDLWDEVRRLVPLLEACEEIRQQHRQEWDDCQDAGGPGPGDQNGERS